MNALQPRARRSADGHGQCTPRPKLAPALTAGTEWNVAGVNSNESRTRFAPIAVRAESSNNEDNSAVTTAAPPMTPNGRLLSSAGFNVSVARAERRPKSNEPHGRASITPKRRRSGHASSVAASSKNDALPPGSTPVRQAWCNPSMSEGDQADGRSKPARTNSATLGMTPGATPANASAASCAAYTRRLRAAGALLNESAPGDGSLLGFRWSLSAALLAGSLAAAALSLAAAAPSAAAAVACWEAPLPPFSAAAGSSVTAMISATASETSAQLRARTWRTDGFSPRFPRLTSPAMMPEPFAAIATRTLSPPPSSAKRARGARARTRAIKSSRVAHAASAASSSLAEDAETFGAASAATVPVPPMYAVAASNSEEYRALALVHNDGNIAR